MIDGGALLARMLDAIEADPELAARLRRLLGGSDDATPIPLATTGQPVRVLRRAIRSGELQAVRVGREYRVTRGDLAEWLEARRVAPRPAAVRQPTTAAERAIDRARRTGALRVVGGSRG